MVDNTHTTIVTGGASGIGRATAEAFAQEGGNVVVADLDAEDGQAVAEELTDDHDGEAIFVETDVSDEENVEETVETTRETFGGLDSVVNNAAVASPEADGPVTELTAEGFDFIVDVNLRGPVHVCKHAIPAMQETGDGTGVVVNNASVAALVAEPGMDTYTATKGGLVSMTRSIAIEYAPDIRANVVCPGVIETPMLEAAAEDNEDVAAMIEETPLPVGQPEDVGSVVTFLASEDARYVTGAVLPVDGGYTAQ